MAAEPHRCIIEAEPNNADTPQLIELPLTISGPLTSGGDIDVYRFRAKNGETIVFTLDSRELGSPLDAVLQITDKDGKSLARSDDAGQRRDPQLTWKSPRNGDYCIAVWTSKAREATGCSIACGPLGPGPISALNQPSTPSLPMRKSRLKSSWKSIE